MTRFIVATVVAAAIVALVGFKNIMTSQPVAALADISPRIDVLGIESRAPTDLPVVVADLS